MEATLVLLAGGARLGTVVACPSCRLPLVGPGALAHSWAGVSVPPWPCALQHSDPEPTFQKVALGSGSSSEWDPVHPQTVTFTPGLLLWEMRFVPGRHLCMCTRWFICVYTTATRWPRGHVLECCMRPRRARLRSDKCLSAVMENMYAHPVRWRNDYTFEENPPFSFRCGSLLSCVLRTTPDLCVHACAGMSILAVPCSAGCTAGSYGNKRDP